MLITAFITAMSACGTVDTSNLESSEAILEQSSVSSTEQANSSAESEAPSSQADISISFQEHSMETEELGAFGYWLYTPENPTENMPLIVYLHGASGRGEDLNLVVADEDFPKYLQSGELGDVRAYVLIPQLPADLRSWSDISDSLYSLIQKQFPTFPLIQKIFLWLVSVWAAPQYGNLQRNIPISLPESRPLPGVPEEYWSRFRCCRKSPCAPLSVLPIP